MPANRKEPLQAHFWFQSLFRGHGPLPQKIVFAHEPKGVFTGYFLVPEPVTRSPRLLPFIWRPLTRQTGAVSLLWSRTDMSRRPPFARVDGTCWRCR